MASKKQEVIIMVGVPASGKSTWSSNFVSQNPNYLRINRDDFRYMLKNQGFCENNVEQLITELMDSAIKKAIAKRFSLIIDNTNLKIKYIQHYIDLCKYNADVKFMVFDVPLNTCIERDANREKSVGKQVIEKMYKDYEIIRDNPIIYTTISKERKRPLITPIIGLDNDAVIFDIDGTIASMNDKRGPFDWKNVGVDDLNDIVAEHISFHRSKSRKIIFLSGRDSICRLETLNWLNKHQLFDKQDFLFMRPENDFRKDTAIKKEIYDNEIKDNFNVIAVYDDRLSVVDMWNKQGLFVFNVNQGLIDF